MEATLRFLAAYSWIYDLQITHFFTDKVWEKIPAEWHAALLSLSTDELNRLPFGFVKDCWPASLRQFCRLAGELAACQQLGPVVGATSGGRGGRTPPPLGRALPPLGGRMRAGMSAKKAHEVTSMAAVVDAMCVQTGARCVVDVGCGLGYLGRVLSSCYGYRVIGLESVASRTRCAEKHARKIDLTPAQFETVTFELRDGAECVVAFDRLLAQRLSDDTRTDGRATSPGATRRERPRRASETSDTGHVTSGGSIGRVTSDTGRVTSNAGCATSDTGHVMSDTGHVTSDTGRATSDTGRVTSGGSTDRVASCRHTVDGGARALARTDVDGGDGSRADGVNGEDGEMPGGRVCLVGLHCCADLTPALLRLFTALPRAAALVCVGCCYHRLTAADDGSFANFPLSSKLKAILAARGGHQSCRLNTYALRLAAQETRSRWKSQSSADHETHRNNVAFRALLELATSQYGIRFRKLRRKVARKKDCTNFETYLDAVFTSMRLEDGNECDARCKLQALYQEHEHYFSYIEPFTALQVMVQPVLESLVVRDRLHYLRESPAITADATPIFNDLISPRNFALIGWRH